MGNAVILSSGNLWATFSNYLPLIVVCVVLALLVLIFRLIGVTARFLWRLIINGIAGALMLSLFDIVFYGLLNMDFFFIRINWLNSVIAGVLGVPGVILLLVLKFIIPM